MPPGAHDPLIGRRLGGRVELKLPIGAGGMGRVYRGWHLVSNIPVAVKVLAQGSDQAALAKRLNVEVVAARRLKHPNVVQVLEAGVDPIDATLYVVMEYVDGKDLAHLVSDGRRLPVARACSIMRDVLAALATAHTLNVVHRDIKPSNIMLTRARGENGVYVDQVKVVDFGLAKLAGEMTSLTQTGFAAGTPGYMAPEQAMGDTLDGRADVYSCGATLYRLLSGRVPFPGDKLAAVLQAMRDEPPPLPEVPPELGRVVRWALARDLSARCPSARELFDALAPFSGPNEPLQVLPAAPAPEAPLRLDAALGLGAPPVELTANERSPATPERPLPPAPPPPRVVVAPPPLALEPPPVRLFPRLAGLAIAFGLGVFVTMLRLDRPAPVSPPGVAAVLSQVTHELALGRTAEAEDALFRNLEVLEAQAAAAPLAARVLELRRDGLYPYDPAFKLTPSRFDGESNGHPFSLALVKVTGWAVYGTVDWTSDKVVYAVRGVWQGNQLLVYDENKVSGQMPGYVAYERKSAFVVVSGGQVLLEGTDGVNARPFNARRVEGTGQPIAELTVVPPDLQLSDNELSSYFSWRSHRLELEADLARREGAPTSPELEQRHTRVLAERPVTEAQAAIIDRIVDALIAIDVRGGNVKVTPRTDVTQLDSLRARYGPLVTRIEARRSELAQAWSR